ncbi:MAG: TraR/DksA C4-type zinc finger protein [Candidatus Paceibacterota bacterium]|jgi:DnaK suppressor protein
MTNEKKTRKIQEIKDKLIAKKQHLVAQLKKFAKRNKGIKDDFRTEFAHLGDHKDENAIESTDYESKLSVEHDLEKGLKNIGNALKKTSEGTYGICSKCKKDINPKRLEVMPEATLCVECSEVRN